MTIAPKKSFKGLDDNPKKNSTTKDDQRKQLVAILVEAQCRKKMAFKIFN